MVPAMPSLVFPSLTDGALSVNVGHLKIRHCIGLVGSVVGELIPIRGIVAKSIISKLLFRQERARNGEAALNQSAKGHQRQSAYTLHCCFSLLEGHVHCPRTALRKEALLLRRNRPHYSHDNCIGCLRT
jgi:hypothetical protein